MKVAIIVLSAMEDEFGKSYDAITNSIKNTWAKNTPNNVDIYYNYGFIPRYEHNPSGYGECKLVEDKIICGVDEAYRNITAKTVECFDFISKNLTEYDFVFRVCNGSYIHIENMLNFLSNKPTTNFYSGIINKYDDFEFASGAGYFLSRDLVKLIGDNKKLIWNDSHDIESRLTGKLWFDDVEVGRFLRDQGITIDRTSIRTDIGDLPDNRQDIFNLTCLSHIEYHYHLRQNIDGMYHLHNLYLNKQYCE